ncbi:MAG: helix-turn-helix transcriptional regulator [Methylophilales bacterium]|nr:helix-turn-helix transcriptional regulator [Methylophilales bacterium]
MNIHATIKMLRKRKGISQEGLAKLTGLHRTYISMLERGIRSPSLVTIEKIASALNIPSWEILKSIHEKKCE